MTKGQIKSIWQLSDVIEELYKRDEHIRQAMEILDNANPHLSDEEMKRLRSHLQDASDISSRASRSAMRVSGVMMGSSAEVYALSDMLAEDVKHKERRLYVLEREEDEGEDIGE